MRKKSDESSHSNLVGSSIDDLLVNKSEYITTGVPPNVLESKLAHELTLSTGETDFEKIQSQAQQLIENEIKNESLVRFPSGNYFHGPRKSDAPQMTNMSCDESDSLLTTADEDEDEDEDDPHEKNDEDYQPRYSASSIRVKREGRTSARMKKSRFDSDEYVFPTILKNLNKTRLPPVPVKTPRKKPGRKPKKRPVNTCAVCRNNATEALLSNTCKLCTSKAHQVCVEKEMKIEPLADSNSWICSYCKPPTPSKFKCSVCSLPSGREMGILITCDLCQTKYHKSCHSPIIETKNPKTWRCVNCPQLKSPARGVKRTETTDSPEADATKVKRPLLQDACYACSESFPNPVDKLVCLSCKKSFHSGCCRVRDVANIMRLGSRKNKWRCDSCKMCKGRRPSSCRVVLPRLRLKKELLSDCSSEDDREPQLKRSTKNNESPSKGDNHVKDEVEEDSHLEADNKDHPRSPNSMMVISKAEWWTARLRPIVVSKHQPPLGPIPDPSVPDVTPWSCQAIAKYFDDYFLDKSIGQVFIDQDIDGKALKLMRRIDILKTFDSAGFKLDSILDVMQHIKRLQLRVNDRRYIWADVF